MSGILLNRLTTKVRAQLKRTLKGNKTYKKHRWNLVERAQVYCSTHYLKAMFLLWAMAGSAVLIAIGFRAEFSSFAANYLKNVTKLPEWMSNLLGAQLTIIGIVFPLVVGLISVLFQKNPRESTFRPPISCIRVICLRDSVDYHLLLLY